MTRLSVEEERLLDHAAAAPMLDQVQRWAMINSGSRNIDGLAHMATMLADASAEGANAGATEVPS